MKMFPEGYRFRYRRMGGIALLALLAITLTTWLAGNAAAQIVAVGLFVCYICYLVNLEVEASKHDRRTDNDPS